jgi:hypothetical protein
VTYLTPAERLLQELGITEPEEIDLEAIAFHLGACVRFRKLDGCEARIIGCNHAAIITIDEDCSHRRKRFSLAHEIGHWTHHKGQTLVCRVEESRPQERTSPERIANNYAADLLMPRYLFAPTSGADALNVLGAPMFSFNRRVILEKAAALRLPAIYEWPEMAEEGGLIGYGPRLPLIWRQAARLVVKVLRGITPKDLPVEQPTNFDLVVNLITAKALGLTIPESFLLRADQVIE